MCIRNFFHFRLHFFELISFGKEIHYPAKRTQSHFLIRILQREKLKESRSMFFFVYIYSSHRVSVARVNEQSKHIYKKIPSTSLYTYLGHIFSHLLLPSRNWKKFFQVFGSGVREIFESLNDYTHTARKENKIIKKSYFSYFSLAPFSHTKVKKRANFMNFFIEKNLFYKLYAYIRTL